MSCGCGCAGAANGCGEALPSAEAALRDPFVARKLAAALGHGGSPTIGKLFVWCSDVEDLKLRISASMIATDALVKKCTALSADDRKAWGVFFDHWNVFLGTSCLVFGAGAAFDEAEEWRIQLGQWQELLGKSCALNLPQVSTEPEGALLASSLKWLAVAAVAGAVVYGVHAFVK